MDEVQISDIQSQVQKLQELEKRRLSILNSIEEQGKLTDELRQKIMATYNSTELEDLYLPYKKKRKTRASVAKEKGLEPLAKTIFEQRNHSRLTQPAIIHHFHSFFFATTDINWI